MKLYIAITNKGEKYLTDGIIRLFHKERKLTLRNKQGYIVGLSDMDNIACVVEIKTFKKKFIGDVLCFIP